MYRALLLALISLFVWPSVTQAQETYSPEFCNFQISFPEAPYSARRCEGENNDRCYDLVSYTRVFDMRTTVNFRVICNPIDEAVKARYSPDVMGATLRAMTKNSVVEEYNMNFTEEDSYKMAGLVGEGMSGRTPTIYIAQLWIGENSAFSVEAELIGDIHDEADTVFRDILNTIQLKRIGDKAD